MDDWTARQRTTEQRPERTPPRTRIVTAHAHVRHLPIVKPPSFTCIFTYRGAQAAQHGVQVTPLARPVNRGVFGVRPVPSAVAFTKVASGAPDALRWAALFPTHGADPSGQPESSRIPTSHWG